jgi:hypothetical protein
MVNGAPASAAAVAAVQALTMSPVDMHGAVSASMGLGMLVNSQGSSPINGNPGSSLVGVNGSGGGSGVGGQANSPLAMKELSPAHKPMIETYLNRYLNYLCVNREFLSVPPSICFSPLFSSSRNSFRKHPPPHSFQSPIDHHVKILVVFNIWTNAHLTFRFAMGIATPHLDPDSFNVILK